jgi:lipooligosaccharide transport system permease protein
MAGLRWVRTFHAVVATPVRVGELMGGLFLWAAARMLVAATLFAIVAGIAGAFTSPLAVLTPLAATLCGLAFATPMAALAARIERPDMLTGVFRFAILPIFLFSGTFFPIDQLPAQIQWVAWLLPLWHGVALARALSLGIVMDNPWLNLAHLVILLMLATAGIIAMFVFYRRQLEK